jgi:oligopeptide transport system substrate-binding protein
VSTPPPRTQRIFVSHSHKDDEWCRGFVNALQAAGNDAWYDTSELQAADLWIPRIQQELRQRDIYLVIVTPDSAASPWVQREMQLALAANKRILPVIHKRLAGHEIDEIGFLRIYQWIDVVGEDAQAAATRVDAALRGSPATAGKVFISYRPEDSGRSATRIRDSLAARFGGVPVLMDVRPVGANGDQRPAIVDAVGASSVVLVVIGPRWLGATDAQDRRRLDDPDDPVRIELETALQQDKLLLPLLVDGASMPAAADLPESMRALAARQATVMNPAHLSRDVERTLRAAAPGWPVPRVRVRRRALYAGFAAVLAVIVLAVATWSLGPHLFGTRFGLGGATPQPTQPPAAPESQQVLHFGEGCLNTLDPQIVSIGCDYETTQLVFPSLVQLDDQLRVESWAASKITVSTDGKTYTFTLRQGLAWSDATPITAGDFAFAINRAVSPCTQALAASLLFLVADASTFNGEPCANGMPSGAITTLISRSLQVVDARTLAIHLDHPAAYFLEALTYPTSWAVPQTLISRYGAQWTDHLADAGGLGGDLFKVTAWQPGKKLVLQRNGRFWGTQPKLHEIDFTVYTKPNVMYAAYLAGTGDVSEVARDQYTSARLRPDFHESGSLVSLNFSLDWSRPPFNDVRIRQAFALALDKTQLATEIYANTAYPTNHIVPQGMPGYYPGLTGPDSSASLTGNASAARGLANDYASDQCGGQLSRCPPVVLAAASDFPELLKLAAEAQIMWQQALPGYPITVRKMPYMAIIQQELAGTAAFQIWNFVWGADFPDPWDWLSNQFLPGSPINLGHVNLPEANTLMRQADVDQNSARRLSEYNQAEQLLVTDVAWIPLFQVKTFYVAQPYVTNYQVTGLGSPSSNTWQRVYIARH